MIGRPPLVPKDFEVPLRVETERFVLLPLTLERFFLDYESYMSSIEHLQSTFDNNDDPMTLGGERWPANSSVEFAVIDAAWCQFEWQIFRSSFTYVALNFEETKQLGAGYIFPCIKPGFDIECQTWVRADSLAEGFDEEFFQWFHAWVEREWPFDKAQIACPGRDIRWEEWNALPDQQGWNAMNR